MTLVALGDHEAFRELAYRLRPRIKAFVKRLGCGVTESDDLAQESLVRLWVHRGSYRRGRTLLPYLLTIAKNAYLTRTAGRAPEPQPTEPSQLERMLLRAGWQTTGPEAAVLDRYREYRLARAVAALPAEERLTFVLRHSEGLKYREVAQVLGVPEGTVKSRMFRAVRLLRAALPDLDPNRHEEEI